MKLIVKGESVAKDLYYWEGPGTSYYRVLAFVSERFCREYIERRDSFNARWEIRDATPCGEFVLAKMA